MICNFNRFNISIVNKFIFLHLEKILKYIKIFIKTTRIGITDGR